MEEELGSARKKEIGPIPEKIIRRKKEVYDKIDNVLREIKKDIQYLFEKVDADRSHQITTSELRKMFSSMRMDDITEDEC